MVGNPTGDSDHGKASVLELLHSQAFLGFGVDGPHFQVVNGRFGTAQEALSLHLLVVFPTLEDTADDDELGPPLRIGLEDGIDGVGGCDILGIEGSEHLREDPPDSSKHGGASVGEFGSTGPVSGNVVTEVKRVELYSIRPSVVSPEDKWVCNKIRG